MVTEFLSDEERNLLISLVVISLVVNSLSSNYNADLEALLRKLTGTDTRIIVERAYSSQTNFS